MGEKLKTIKELADELGVSKKKIHYQVSKLDSNLIRRLEGTIYLGNKAISEIKSNIGYNSVSNIDTPGVQNRYQLDRELDTGKIQLINEKSEQITYLKEQLKIKDKQLSVKDEQIENLAEAQKQTQNLLDQQQRLALQDKKLLEEYKSEINDLKALKMPAEGRQAEQAGNQPQEVPNVVEETTEVPRKWWQFWKK